MLARNIDVTRRRTRALVLLAALVSASSLAEPFEDALQAQKRGDYAEAIRLYDEALMLEALTVENAARVLHNRGSAYAAIGELEKAELDLTRVLRLNPNPGTHATRGAVRFMQGRYAAATTDFGSVVRSAPDDPYAAIWFLISQARDGRWDQAELLRWSGKLRGTQWPAPIFDAMSGTITPQRALDLATTAEPAQTRGRQCEAYFFLAQLHMTRGEDARGRQLLGSALERCPPAYMEHTVARAELGEFDGAASAAAPVPSPDPAPAAAPRAGTTSAAAAAPAVAPLPEPKPAPPAATSTPGATPRVVIATTNVRFRAGPGTGFERLGAFPKGREIQVLGTTGDWYRVLLSNGKQAYVHKGYVRPSGAEPGAATSPARPRDAPPTVAGPSAVGPRYVATTNVRFRVGPGIEFERLGAYPKGRTIHVLSTEGDWYRVLLSNGKQAYVHRDYVQRID